MTMPPDLRVEVLAMLERVSDDWPATCDHQGTAYHQQFCNVTFALPNGWRIEVFKDGYGWSDWDYIDRIHAPDGRSWEFPFGEPFEEAVREDDEDRQRELYAQCLLVNWSPTNRPRAGGGIGTDYRGGWAPYRP